MTWQCQLAKPDELGPGTLDRIRAIYEASFPPSLRDSFPALIAPVMSESASLYVASANRVVGGFALTAPLGIGGVNYLAYLAVDGAQRGRGTGGALFRFLLADAYQRKGDTELLWEVERSHDSAGPEDLNRRRIAFYERHGGVLLDRVGDFRMPDLAGPGSLSAALMWTSLIDRASLTAGEIEAYVVALFRAIYRRERDDPLVAAVLRSIRQGS